MSAGFVPRRIFLLAGPLLAASSSCSVLPNPSMAQIYRLSPQVNDPGGHSIPHSRLLVDMPTASQSLDTNRIALTQGRTRFDYYADSVWTDRLPTLLQTLLVEAFEADGRITELSRDAYSLTRGYLLRTDIRLFEAQYAESATGPPDIAVALDLHLSANPEGRSVGNKLISARAQAAQNKLDAIVIAFDTATGDALAQSVTWTVRAISRNRVPGSHP